MAKSPVFFYNFIVKKFFLSAVLFSLFFSLFALESDNSYVAEVPELLKGIWQGKDRLILFSGDDAELSCILRVFYSWYDDRAAEPASYAQISARNRNNTTAKHPENIQIKYKTLLENSSRLSGAYELQIKYPGLKEFVYIPVAITGGKLYLNFYLRQSFNDEGDAENNAEKYLLKDYGAASGITISPPVIKKELLSYFIDESSIYHIRYWLSDMEYTDQTAEFSDGEKVFEINKFILTAGKLFTCTSGRAHKIRNIQKSDELPYKFETDEEKMIYVYGEPYLVYVPDSGKQEQLLKIVDKDNKRKAPQRKPPFPVSHIDFHWKEISELEMYNPYTWNRRNIDIYK